MSGVGMPAHLHLEVFAAVVAEAFDGELPYLVGSATDKGWRDVDVRLILDDDVFDALFPDRMSQALSSSKKWSAMCMAFSALGERMTGLPIDFQIQRQTDANDAYSGPRHALGLQGPLHRVVRNEGAP